MKKLPTGISMTIASVLLCSADAISAPALNFPADWVEMNANPNLR
jgi:hypothetical protein